MAGGIHNSTILWKGIWHYLPKLQIHLPIDPAIPPLGVYPTDKPANIILTLMQVNIRETAVEREFCPIYYFFNLKNNSINKKYLHLTKIYGKKKL